MPLLTNSEDTKRLDEILMAIAQIGQGNFNISLPASDNCDELDAIRIGLSMLNEELKESIHAKAAALKLSDVKSSFLATMSHEIRTPLNGILGTIDLLQDTSLSKQQKDYLAILQSSSSHLFRLVNEVLDFSKLEAEQKEVHYTSFPILQLGKECIETFSAGAKSKNLELTLVSNIANELYVKSDPKILRQVLFNVIGNALNHTVEGHVTLRISLVEKEKNKLGQLTVEVQDSGVGMSKKQSARIFEPFYQVGSENRIGQMGTGLGLAISSKLVNALGGDLTVNSDLGIGSSFSFCIEVDFSLGSAPKDSKKYTFSIIKDLSVLVAEDNKANQTIVMAYLKKWGLNPTLVENGVEAVDLVTKKTFDLILMDCMMPLVDGYQATQKIRALPNICQPWIVALSAAVTEQEIHKCLTSGMDSHLGKPLEKEKLHQLLKNIEKSKRRGTPHG